MRATIAKVPKVAAYVKYRVTQRGELRRYWTVEGEDGFDATHGTDTSGHEVFLSTLSDRPSVQHATSYWPTHVRDVRRMIGMVVDHEDHARRVDPSKRVFVDIGCGKGRTVFVAAEWPFIHLHGVELVHDLARTAKKNLELFRNGAEQTRITIHEIDALEFVLPDPPLLIYLFHPFGLEVMKPFVDRLADSLKATPRPCTIVYLNPAHEDLLLATGLFVSERFPDVRDERRFSILHGPPTPSPS